MRSPEPPVLPSLRSVPETIVQPPLSWVQFASVPEKLSEKSAGPAPVAATVLEATTGAVRLYVAFDTTADELVALTWAVTLKVLRRTAATVLAATTAAVRV